MISPLTLALQGLQPGSSPIKIATQGFILEITPPAPQPEEESAETFFIPMTWTAPRIRKDCVITVQGCRATLSATAGNVAAGMPTTEELDEMDDLAWIEDIRRMAAEAAMDEEEEIQFQVWEHFQELEQEARRRDEEARAFRKNVASLAKDLRKGPRREIVEISKVMVGFAEENFELRRRLEALESKAAVAKKPAANPSRKTQKR